MTRILAPILLVVLLFPSLALGEGVKWDDLVKRDFVFYKKFTTIPFTGKVTGQYQGKMRNGKRHGPWVLYRENGQLWSKGNWKNGNQDGPWVSYHSNGQLNSKETYKDGMRDGPAVHYKMDGTVDEEYTGTYRNGKKVK